jgi:hypothetical protein
MTGDSVELVTQTEYANGFRFYQVVRLTPQLRGVLPCKKARSDSAIFATLAKL